ncbi:MAG: HTTM domain-containing protein [Flammeovirgaceae bacterium]
MTQIFQTYLKKDTDAAPLAVFRIFFGLIMLFSMIRFYWNGWIESFYLQPKLFFSYDGFEWVKPLGDYTYLLFIVCVLSCLFIVLGYKYRLAAITFFLSFTYIELMDKTTYLNHYYFTSLMGFILIFLPANAYYSIDAAQNQQIRAQYIPQWSIDAVKLMLGIVYFYAGLAKLNSDWLIDAMPLSIWLPARYDYAIIGGLFKERWVHYAFSWSGALYDLFVPFLLLYRKTRKLAFLAVVIFHLLTGWLFPIGMFPYIMIVSTLIFFHHRLHHQMLDFISKLFRINKTVFDNTQTLSSVHFSLKRLAVPILSVFFMIQLAFPFRYLLYPGELFWTEEGYRFSWRVMLMEKVGYAQFKVKDAETNRQFYVDNADFLTPFQEKQMATQPDFIWEFAQYLKTHFQNQGISNPQIYVESYVTLNGRRSQPFIDPTIDLTTIQSTFKHKTWILPFNDEIKGL